MDPAGVLGRPPWVPVPLESHTAPRPPCPVVWGMCQVASSGGGRGVFCVDLGDRCKPRLPGPPGAAHVGPGFQPLPTVKAQKWLQLPRVGARGGGGPGAAVSDGLPLHLPFETTLFAEPGAKDPCGGPGGHRSLLDPSGTLELRGGLDGCGQKQRRSEVERPLVISWKQERTESRSFPEAC